MPLLAFGVSKEQENFTLHRHKQHTASLHHITMACTVTPLAAQWHSKIRALEATQREAEKELHDTTDALQTQAACLREQNAQLSNQLAVGPKVRKTALVTCA
jgi:hypothetical protein